MKTFTQPMQGLKEFEDLEAALPKLSGVIRFPAVSMQPTNI